MLAIDVGRKRIGLALSDPSGTLARPWKMVPHAPSLAAAVGEMADLIGRLVAEDDGLGAVVVGLPTRLDGRPTEATPHARAFAEGLRAWVTVPVVLQDERLTSVEAESRLAARARDWKTRKAQLDAAAAAVILQDYLDAQRSGSDPLP